MSHTFQTLPKSSVRLLPGLFMDRFEVNRRYMLSLKTPNLLQNYYLEAGLWAPRDKPTDGHWGWESPTCQLRGHFLGHWLSAAAHLYACSHDQEVKGKADYIVSELARCQVENGGEWAGSIPEKYLDWAARGKEVWAPHYTVHKTLMGLYDMYAWGGNEQALDILVKWARWFHRWTSQFARDELDAILDVETGGMLEVWANLYGITGDQEHLELLKRYERRRLFDPLLAGKDVLTNMHANTTIPEIQGAARAWEVTGEERWRKVVEAYWHSAVDERGYYCTGGQTNGEIWAPPGGLSARLGEKTQEHCTVYNMMRLADYLLRWTGEARFADYWERNLYNGVLAQQHSETGMITYWLPLRAGSVKKWGSPTADFWCCHGTLVQAHTIYTENIFYQEGDNLVLSQYIPSQLEWDQGRTKVKATLSRDTQLDQARRPLGWVYNLELICGQPTEFALKFRLPGWLSGEAKVIVNGEEQAIGADSSGFAQIHKMWHHDVVQIHLPQRLTCDPLPDMPSMVAFMEGPIVLAGIQENWPDTGSVETVHEQTLFGSTDNPNAMLVPDNEREWQFWRPGYRTIHQPKNIRLIPLYEIRDERYQVYFPVEDK
ncbi:MAG: glycoside hydrolase family 127 protein [Chloroflexi bacterium]|nr:glycoside hydrolase family 127 protein [Chloroflexota bacterium]